MAGRQVFRHPSIQGRHYIIEKLMTFHRLHETDMRAMMADINQAIGQIPRKDHTDEATPLREELEKIEERKSRGPKLLGDILPLVLERLGVGVVQSEESGEGHSH